MKRRTNLGKGWCRRKCKYFRMHIRKYNRAFGRDVCHKRAYHESWHYRASKQTRSRGAAFFSFSPVSSLSLSLSFFSPRATRCYTASACMQRQYFECIMNGARREWGPTDSRSKRLRLVNSAEVPFPYFAFAQHSHLQQQFFVSGPTRVCLASDRVGPDPGYIVEARVCASGGRYYFSRSTSWQEDQFPQRRK